tara:strand:+ start:384 stop:713 length:330 start_codon:yes stop_codon:yes gene_type:complete
MIKYILAALFVALFCYGLFRPLTSLYSKFFLIFGSLLGLFSVLGEEYTTYIANVVGVGRGADLYLYLGLITVFLFILYTINKFKLHERKTSSLIQKIALLEAIINKNKK